VSQPADPSVLACASCGAPLAPEPRQVRVTCRYCGAASDIASEAALRLAGQLAGKIRVAPKLMSVEDIEADIREREQRRRSQQRHALIVAMIVAGVLLGIVALLAIVF
jgi:hypothetical protein